MYIWKADAVVGIRHGTCNVQRVVHVQCHQVRALLWERMTGTPQLGLPGQNTSYLHMPGGAHFHTLSFVLWQSW